MSVMVENRVSVCGLPLVAGRELKLVFLQISNGFAVVDGAKFRHRQSETDSGIGTPEEGTCLQLICVSNR